MILDLLTVALTGYAVWLVGGAITLGVKHLMLNSGVAHWQNRCSAPVTNDA